MKDPLAIFHSNGVQTIIALALCVVGYFIFRFIFKRSIKDTRKRDKILFRIKYIFYLLSILFIFQIWVEGFFQILALIGFIGAGIIITQRDNIMNMVGWLIISWRELFIEGDLIKISNFTGVVKSTGILYFTLQEADELNWNETTGRTIKVPNGFVSKNAIINYTTEKTHRANLSFTFSKETDMTRLSDMLNQLTEELRQHFKSKYEYDESITNQIRLTYTLTIRQSKPAGVETLIHCYCPLMIKNEVLTYLHQKMYGYMKGENGFQLAIES